MSSPVGCSTATAAMRWRVESWDPGYGASTDEQPGRSKIEPTLDVEVAPSAWRPVDPKPLPKPWSSVLFVDGVRRIDAIGWGGESTSSDGTPSMGLFASYAAGAVRCRPGHAELLDAEVHRGVFSGAEGFADVLTSAGRYVGEHVPLKPDSPPAQQLGEKVQERMRAAELVVSQRVRAGLDEADLLVVDGPLHNQVRLPRTLGYAKTHSTHYLPVELNRLVGTLVAGQRTPVFGLGDRFSWYLKLPGGSGAPWAGVVRVECWAELPPAAAIELAAGSQPTLCRYASTEYKDARAPQNLYPIAGCERELHRRLGDQRLLHRAIRAAFP
ncbi:MAG: hypothetical protein M3Z25_11130 [Actinomycetota bacterium]|nr:hypothetical protein [Actinomycetota bacterium]